MVDGKRQLELGWALLHRARRQGFATEIGRAGLDYAFGVLGHNEVVSFTEVYNSASRAVMERLGMTFVKIIYERGLIEGRDGIHDGAPFALYRLRREDAAPPPAAQAR
jgi:RimJ/RimL family protein N-acetyltransferase